LALVSALYFIGNFHERLLVQPLHPAHPDVKPIPSALYWTAEMASNSMALTGFIFQLYFNQAHGTFAGMYKIDAFLRAGTVILTLLLFFSPVMGTPFESRRGLSYDFALSNAPLTAISVWQAMTLKSVQADLEDEKD
jgi:hypothetical protein